MADNTHNRRAIWGVPEKLQLHIAMLTLQFGYAGFHVVSRAALNMGISKLVFPVYRNIIALLLLLPFAYFLEKKERPGITLNFLIQFFFLALIGITANQGFYLLGLDYTSPTFASSMQNSVPAITFLMAALLRIERVRLNRRDGISKVLGTGLCVAGASVITLYKGPTIYTPTSHLHAHLLTTNPAVLAPLGDAVPKNWTLGCLYLIGHCLSWSAWLVFQAPVLKKYPARLSVTSYTCFFGIIQFLIIAAFCERDSQAWVFHSGWELFTILYAGIVASGIAFAVQIWCIDRGGPVFVAVYQPVQTLVVAIMASIALGEEFYLGGIIGAVLIIAGLYFVLYGKSEERKFAALEKAEIQTIVEHGIERVPVSRGSIKSSITVPLLHQSTDNV
ncbi:PREDICTED: protein WALLS ARE THIN 1-like [Brassica oleracea var. oleracea]|uniref:WAT1-related protein n=1 Tax=Brassica oleracea var. oleracea TaxID=109376 RepID=A0A0D3AQQ9_BRAOL|nr:PREDICTED: protein WALLS ARE THIN 1-like [Brassica oleracea var. oleracea]